MVSLCILQNLCFCYSPRRSAGALLAWYENRGTGRCTTTVVLAFRPIHTNQQLAVSRRPLVCVCYTCAALRMTRMIDE